jgi:two-component system cell cycle sensor histidine kinase/response regulator CckA
MAFVAAERKKQILIVEDEGLIAADVQRRLENLGYCVSGIAASAEEALVCARSTPFDLVLMDIHIRGDMDGIDTAKALTAEFEMPVVYMTAHSDQETLLRAKLTEPYGYVLKPVGNAALRSAVQIAIYKSEMDRRLRASEAWLSATLRSVGDGIIATNSNCEIEFLNNVAEQLTGWQSAEAKGRQLAEVIELFDEVEALPAKNPVFDLFAGESRAYTLISRSGKRLPVEVECFENRAGEEVLGVILMVRDIRARKEMEGRLVQGQRMEAVASMAGALAHEFNNQLTVILGYAYELVDRLAGDDRQDVMAIRDAATTASSISRQLLTLSRRDAVRSEVLNISDVVRDIEPILSHTLGHSRTLTADLGSSAAFVRGDRNQLKQILLNLTLNARDAMPTGGQLQIETRPVEIGAGSIEGRHYRPGRYARLRFRDSGVGMDKATLARIFEPFFTTKGAGRGSGLGLSIVHSSIAQAGGYITATSEPGGGTTFEIMLPCVGTFQRVNDGAVLTSGNGVVTVLLVDDEDSIRKLVHTYLEREGYQLLEARNAEEALAIAEVYPEPIHVLVTDVVMPGMTGPELAQRLTALRPDLHVIFVSGYRREAMGDYLGGEQNLLSKPFPAAELLKRVRLLLGQAAPLVN